MSLINIDMAEKETTESSHKEKATLDLDAMSSSYTTLLQNVVPAEFQESQRQGLEKTPMRAAKAMAFFTKGYSETLDGKRRIIAPTPHKLCFLSSISA